MLMMSSGFDALFRTPYFLETAQHIQDAMKNGHPDIVTISRLEATERRAESLKDIATKKGLDRDEWPMAMFKEGGKGASVRYISPTDNRGAWCYYYAYVKREIKRYKSFI